MKPEEESPIGYPRIHIDIGKGHRILYPEKFGGEARSGDQVPMVVPQVSHLGWGHWYTLRELEVSTNGFADENVIGEGGYGIVYHGVFADNTQVAVKNLLNNRYFNLCDNSLIVPYQILLSNSSTVIKMSSFDFRNIGRM